MYDYDYGEDNIGNEGIMDRDTALDDRSSFREDFDVQGGKLMLNKVCSAFFAHHSRTCMFCKLVILTQTGRYF